MRKLIALVVLLCGATGAYADRAPSKWCSKDGKQIIQVTSSDYRLDGKKIMDDWTPIQKDGVWGFIYQGRVFWPCP